MNHPSPLRVDTPFYGRTRLVRGGPWVPAALLRRCCCTIGGGDENAEHDWTEACDRYPRLVAIVAGEVKDPLDPGAAWPWHPLSRAEHDYLVADMEWCRQWSPGSPLANPRRPVSRAHVDLI